MKTTKITYRSGYKYQLAEDYSVQTGGDFGSIMVPGFVSFVDGVLTIRAGYAWDGPSGPTYDSKTFMRGSLVHDALYQLIREGHFLGGNGRLFADALLRQHCREDGMNWFRAWYVYRMIRMFGTKAAMAANKKAALTAP